MKLGLLFPLSNVHPSIGSGFVLGLKAMLATKQLQDAVTIIKEPIGLGSGEKEVYQKAEKLLMVDEVDLLIAFVDEKAFELLNPLIQAADKPVLLVNAGANYPLNWVAQPNVIRLNLQHAFACYLSGTLAAKGGNKQGALVSSFYDCGYLHTAAIVNGFTENGGQMLHNYINNQRYDEGFEIGQLTDFITANPACTQLLSVLDELPASLVYDRLKQYNAAVPIHLYVSPMMLQGAALKNIESGFVHAVDGYMPWHAGLAHEANQQFINSCKEKASIFSLLGWEIGLIIAALKPDQQQDWNGDAVIASLLNKKIEGPRGTLTLDPDTQIYMAPLYHYYKSEGTGHATIESVSDLGKDWKAFTAKSTEGHVTGWTNTYLCY